MAKNNQKKEKAERNKINAKKFRKRTPRRGRPGGFSRGPQQSSNDGNSSDNSSNESKVEKKPSPAKTSD